MMIGPPGRQLPPLPPARTLVLIFMVISCASCLMYEAARRMRATVRQQNAGVTHWHLLGFAELSFAIEMCA
jgi:hypothetical protein